VAIIFATIVLLVISIYANNKHRSGDSGGDRYKNTSYESDVVAWSHEQARLLRSGQLSDLDIEHIADEIEDVGKSEQRELANRMAILLAHLLKCEYQPNLRPSWKSTIHAQRNSIDRRIHKTPSLKASLANDDWWADAWGDAVVEACKETGMAYAGFPETCPWSADEVLDRAFFPVARSV
jgi:hypothetical protein